MLFRPILRIRLFRSRALAERMAKREIHRNNTVDIALARRKEQQEEDGRSAELSGSIERVDTATTGPHVALARGSNWLVDFVEALGATGLFGGSITFSVLIVDIAEVSTSSFIDQHTVRLLVSIAWGCFTFQLGIAVLIRILYHDDLLQQLKDKGLPGSTRRFLEWLLSVAVIALSSLALFSFVFLGVAVSAYVGWPGWVVAGGALFLWLVMCALCVYEFIGKKANRLFFDL